MDFSKMINACRCPVLSDAVLMRMGRQPSTARAASAV